MAISESIRRELSAVFDARVEVDCFCRSLEELDPRSENPIVFVLRCQIDRWASACDALEKTVIQRALPLVQDFESLTKT
jgi:hypothetical protein